MENKALRPLKRLRDYDKTLPVLELYTAVQSKVVDKDTLQ